MSTRASRPRQPVAYFSGSDSDEPLAASTSKASPAPTKKARTTRNAASKTSAKRVRTKLRGFGSKVADFPIDILYEILLYVGPLDILNMSRVNKGVHDALTSNSSRFVWKKAIENANLPQCPEDLNEMKYIHFALDPYCDVCGSVGRKRQQFQYMYRSREKVCTKCFKTDFDCFSFHDCYIPFVEVTKKTKRYRSREYYGLRKDITAWFETSANFAGDYAAKRKWIDEQKLESEARLKLQPRLEAWFERDDEAEADKRKDVRKNRLDAIIEKMKAEGWSEEVGILEEGAIMSMESLKRVKAVNTTANLTQQAWEKMKPELAALIEEIRKVKKIADGAKEQRRLRELRAEQVEKRLPPFQTAFHDYLSARPYDPYGLKIADIIQTPEAKAVIFKPLEEEVDQDAYNQFFSENFEDISAKLRSSAEDRLLELMKEKLPEATKEDLWDPSVVFECNLYNCHKRFSTSGALTHSKCDPWDGDDIVSDQLKGHHAPWKGFRLAFDITTYSKAKNALSRLRLVPAYDLMCLELYECLECSEESGRRVFMTWFEAVMSSPSCVLDHEHTIQPALLTDNEKQFKEAYIDLKLANSSDAAIICATCHAQLQTRDSYESPFERHQLSAHERKALTWKEGVDFYRTPDIMTNLSFKQDFTLEEFTDIRSLTIKLLRSRSYGSSYLPDLRTDDQFARENYISSRHAATDLSTDPASLA